jgi:hypothetical protein
MYYALGEQFMHIRCYSARSNGQAFASRPAGDGSRAIGNPQHSTAAVTISPPSIGHGRTRQQDELKGGGLQAEARSGVGHRQK